ncbi:hypothetical protein GCM10009092_37170 [Bowmanella denitrificans]|uniref:TIGR03016 family PEP-CTERM system-associated outer membrane protein n=1 Tax=Bowmanella denitrificans TaxID=366582 RepID=A0ABN0XPR9_9ALTE
MKRISLACALVLHPLASQGADLEVKPTMGASVVTYKTEYPLDGEHTNNNALMLEPSLRTSYTSRALKAALTLKNTSVLQSKNSSELDKSFTDVNFNSNLGLWDQRIQFNAQSSRTHRASFAGDAGLTDPILNAEELSTVQSNNASLSFTPKRPDYVGVSLRAQVGESRTQNNPTSFNPDGDLNSDNLNFNASIYQGHAIKQLYWTLSGDHLETKRSGQDDFTRRSLQARLGFALYQDWHIIAVGSDYDNEGVSNGAGPNNVDSKSYGAGLEWRKDSGRYIGITYNKFKQLNNESNYVGVDLSWPFSSRTAVQASYDKRFFGDNYNLSLNHNNRTWRTRLGYNKGLTSYSQLQLVPGDPLVLVCPQGSVDGSGCFFPDSPGYEPKPDEVQVNIPTLRQELTDEIILRENAYFNLGYNRSKLLINLNYNYGYMDYLESSRSQRNRSLELSATYKLGGRTDLKLANSYVRTDSIEGSYGQEVRRYSVTLNRNVSKAANLSLTLRYLEREAEDVSRNLEDTRLTLNYIYRF